MVKRPAAQQLTICTALPSSLLSHVPAKQARHIKRQAEALAVRNGEVQRACEEMLDLVASWPRENAGSVRVAPEAANVFRDYCSNEMYKVGYGC